LVTVMVRAVLSVPGAWSPKSVFGGLIVMFGPLAWSSVSVDPPVLAVIRSGFASRLKSPSATALGPPCAV
jgi:hypothetical protein